MKKLKKLLANAVFFSGHYGVKASNKLLELGLNMHVNFDTDTGRKIVIVRNQLESQIKEQAKPQSGEQYARGQSIFVKTNGPKSS